VRDTAWPPQLWFNQSKLLHYVTRARLYSKTGRVPEASRFATRALSLDGAKGVVPGMDKPDLSVETRDEMRRIAAVADTDAIH
jgi:hypothetical protein